MSLAYDRLFVRQVFTLTDMAEQFNLPKDVLLWMGEPGGAAWWNAMRDLALTRNTPIPEFHHRTAEHLVSTGKTDAVVSYLLSIESGSSG